MHHIRLQLSDDLYDQAQRRATQEDLTTEVENLDHRFTAKVIAHLNQIQEEIQLTEQQARVHHASHEKSRMVTFDLTVRGSR